MRKYCKSFVVLREDHESLHLPSPTRPPAVPTRGRAPQGTRTTPSRSTSTASSSRPLAKRCFPAPVREEAWTQDGERWGGEVCSVVLGCIYRCIFIECRISHSEAAFTDASSSSVESRIQSLSPHPPWQILARWVATVHAGLGPACPAPFPQRFTLLCGGAPFPAPSSSRFDCMRSRPRSTAQEREKERQAMPLLVLFRHRDAETYGESLLRTQTTHTTPARS